MNPRIEKEIENWRRSDARMLLESGYLPSQPPVLTPEERKALEGAAVTLRGWVRIGEEDENASERNQP